MSFRIVSLSLELVDEELTVDGIAKGDEKRAPVGEAQLFRRICEINVLKLFILVLAGDDSGGGGGPGLIGLLRC